MPDTLPIADLAVAGYTVGMVGDTSKITRNVGAVLVGLLFFALIEVAFNALAKSCWAEYAAAVAARAYPLSVLWSRLAAGAIMTTSAGMMASLVARSAKPAVWLGTLILIVSIFEHSTFWAKYPLWYHLSWFVSILPFAMLGGQIAMKFRPLQPPAN